MEQQHNQWQPPGAGAETDLDKLRIKTQRSNLLRIILWIVAFILGIIIFIAGGPIIGIIYSVIALAIMGFITYKVSKLSKQFNTSFKVNIVKDELDNVLQNVDYRPNERFNDHTVNASGLFRSYDRSSGSDYFIADYKGRRYTVSDLHLEEKEEYETVDSDGNSHTETRYNTLFLGRMIMFDYETTSNDSVYVYDKKMRNIRDAIQTEYDAFNQRFMVRSGDPAAAFRVLIPPMMEKIMQIADRVYAPMSISFLQGKVFVAVSGGNAFEANTAVGKTLAEQRDRVRGEVQVMLNILEALTII